MVAPAYLALAPAAVMLAYLQPDTLLALDLDTVVVADARTPGAVVSVAPALTDFNNYCGGIISSQVAAACLASHVSMDTQHWNQKA